MKYSVAIKLPSGNLPEQEDPYRNAANALSSLMASTCRWDGRMFYGKTSLSGVVNEEKLMEAATSIVTKAMGWDDVGIDRRTMWTELSYSKALRVRTFRQEISKIRELTILTRTETWTIETIPDTRPRMHRFLGAAKTVGRWCVEANNYYEFPLKLYCIDGLSVAPDFTQIRDISGGFEYLQEHGSEYWYIIQRLIKFGIIQDASEEVLQNIQDMAVIL